MLQPGTDVLVMVSVIMPAYNAATTIAEAIESVRAQTAPNWELIVVNDGSTDNTVEIVASLAAQDSRIRIVNRLNGGESAARNTGIAEARYDWLVFLDADDWILPAYLERVTKELAADPALDAVHCGWARIALDGTRVVETYRPPTGDLFPTLARRAAFPVHACIVRKSLVETAGGFDTTLRKSPDWDLWQRIARAGANFGDVPEILAHYRMTPHSASLEAEQMFADGLTVLKRGHAPDPRVANPRPEYAGGLAGSVVESQEFYLLCWCAGLLLGSGRDARCLLRAVGDDTWPGLYPDAIAQCIFDSATLPSCHPRHDWERLWPELKDLTLSFLTALEAQTGTADLAGKALIELKKLVLKSSLTWGPVMDELRQTIAQLESDRDRWRQQAETSNRDKADVAVHLQELRRAHDVLSVDQHSLRVALTDMGWLDALSAEKLALQTGLEESHTRIRVLEEGQALLASALEESRRANESLAAEQNSLRSALRDMGMRLDVLSAEKLELESALAAMRERFAAVLAAREGLETCLEDLRRRAAAMADEKATLEALLLEARERVRILESDKTALASELAEARGRVADLATKNEWMESELNELRSRAEALALELEKWRRSADERAWLIEEIQQETWVRAGLLMGLMKRREVVPASLEMSPRPGFSPDDPNVTPNWEYRIEPGNEAYLIYPRGDREMLRVGITKAKTTNEWDIQVNRPGLKVAAGGRYVVAFRGRAARPRQIAVGFAKAYSPWSSLGLYTRVRLTPEWQTFREEFVAEADDDNARIHFDLGGKSIGVDLTSVVLQRVDRVAQEDSGPDEGARASGQLA